MSQVSQQQAVIMIVGPTGVGKTRLSIDLALKINGEIISADSRYLYRGMDIGTAKPGIQERKGVPHHLIDTANPDDTWSLALFLEKSYQLIEDVHSRGNIPIIVGGTGQYMRALTEGWRVPEFVADENLRRNLVKWSDEIGRDELHRKLSIVDPEAANIIDPSNVRRTIRALEVIFSTGIRFTTLRAKDGPAYDYWIIGLTMEREELYRRIDQRIEEMFSRGFVKEVEDLLLRGFGPNLPSMSAIGYREVTRYLKGEINLESAKELMKSNTRRFIRRQSNWFKRSDPKVHWYSMASDPIKMILKDLPVSLRLREFHE